jgi:tetratricopeptide (TPR) repeat protein
MKVFLVCVAMILYAGQASGQRKYSNCNHAYCSELHIYNDFYGWMPSMVKLAVNDTEVNPVRRVLCESQNKSAKKFYKAGFDSLVNIVPVPSLDKYDWRGERMKMALIYFRGAIKNDPDFCDAYDQLINCYFLLYQYDSVLAIVNRQGNPSFHSKLAKGVVYDVQKNYDKEEEYFQSLILTERVSMFYYYLIKAQIELNKLDDAVVNASEMERCLVEWGDGWAMMEQKMFLLAIAQCKLEKFDEAYPLLERIKRQYDRRPDWTHYYGLALSNKTDPDKKKGQKLTKRALELGYDPEKML